MKLRLIIFLFSCVFYYGVGAQNKPVKTIITGKVEDPSVSKITSFILNGTILRQMVDADVNNSTFTIEYELDRPMQAFISPAPDSRSFLYLKPGKKYEILFDSANKLIVKDESKVDQIALNDLKNKISSYSYFANKKDWVLPANEFLAKVENQEIEIKKLIQESAISEAHLREMILLEAKDNFITSRIFYTTPYVDTAVSKWYAKIAPELKFPEQKISSNYYDFSNKLEWNNPLLLDVISDIEMTLTTQYIRLQKVKNPSSSVDFGVEAYKAILKQLTNEVMYNSFAFQAFIKYCEPNKEEWIKYREEIIKNLTDKKLVDEAEKIYLKRKDVADKIAKLRDLPRASFVFTDTNEKPVSLKDFEGKFIYLDFWGTWCGPCVYEIPSLEKLQKEYENKNIVFVSLDFGDTKKVWLEFLKKKEMGGIQLFGDQLNDNEILKFYAVSGFPTFMLLDRSGRIIDFQMPRPSSPGIRPVLNRYLDN